MTRSIGVLGALQGPDELAFVTAVEALAPRVVLARRCGDVAELLAAVHAGLGRIAVVSGDLPGLDRDVVATVHAAGVSVVALADPPEGWLADRSRALGIAVVVAPAAAVEAVAEEAARLDPGAQQPPGATTGSHEARHGRDGAGQVAPSDARPLDADLEATRRRNGTPAEVREPGGPSRTPDPGRGSRLAGEREALTAEGRPGTDGPGAGAHGAAGPTGDAWPPGDEALAGQHGPSAPGSLVAVWGPTGAPGRTTVAVNLAAELAALGKDEVLLVDADTYGGTVAQSLGMLDEAPGIAAAARAAGQGVLDRAALALLAPVVSEGLRVLTGISRASRWAELPGPSLDAVWDVARTVTGWTVVDCGLGLEDDEALSYDTRAPRRNAATLSALAAADLVVVVGAADPIGVQRLVRGLAELDEVGPPGGRVVVANRLRASAVGPRPGDVVAAALERYAGVSDLRLVPDDRPALDAAVLRGGALREVVPGSPARKALAALAADLAAARAQQLDTRTPARRRRSGRRAAARP